jgi:hypothetical protein
MNATREQANILLKNNAGKQFYHSGANVWIFSFGDGTCFWSSEKIKSDKLKELEQIAQDIANGLDPYDDDWF